MPTQYARVVRFNPNSNWGFARINGTDVEAFMHMNTKRRVCPMGFVMDDIRDTGLNKSPKEGDELVLNLLPDRHGQAVTIHWAFRIEWDGVYNPENGGTAKEMRRRARFSEQEEGPTKTESPKSEMVQTAQVAITPKREEVAPKKEAVPKCMEEEPLTVEELFKVFDYHFLHAILDGVRAGEITIDLLQKFTRNTPNGKRGEALYKAYQKWSPHNVKEKKTVARFMERTLEILGFIV
jgi:hypothetical protein